MSRFLWHLPSLGFPWQPITKPSDQLSEQINIRLNGMKTTRIVALLAFVAAVSGCLSSETQSGAGAGAQSASGNASNNAPIISGSPDAAVLAGDTYTFVPSASDPDDDALTFSIDNKPRWASFDSATGRLSGQALLGDIGTYDGIRITVSDGNVTRSLPEFSVTVTQVGLGSMSLSWTPPTQNTDGTALTDLAGYKFYYGQSSGSYSKTIRVDNGSISTYRIENLLPDTYYIVATALNSAGVESLYSNEAVKTVTSD